MKRIPYSALLLLICFACKKQPIAQSPKAEFIEYAPKPFFDLPNQIDESSGLDSYKGNIYTLNDSGGEPVLYQLSQKGELVQEIRLLDTKNIDWESLDISNGKALIGDIGNNKGNRKDLTILSIDLETKDQIPDRFDFTYKSQTIFDYKHFTTPYDSEALFTAENRVFLITKNWSDRISSLYEIDPNKSGEPVSPLESFPFNMLVTGADYDASTNQLACSGYEDFEMYVYVFSNAKLGNFFTTSPIKLHLADFTGAQVEGICFLDSNQLLITTEKTNEFKGQTWLIDLKDLNN